MWVWWLGWEYPLEEGMATHSSVLDWRIPWTEEPDGSTGSQRVGHDWSNFALTHTEEWWWWLWAARGQEGARSGQYLDLLEGGETPGLLLSWMWGVRERCCRHFPGFGLSEGKDGVQQLSRGELLVETVLRRGDQESGLCWVWNAC